MSTTSNTAKDLYDHLKFLTGQSNLTVADANRLFKYAIDDYSFHAMISDGVHKFDDTTHTNELGQATYPVSSSTVSPSGPRIALDATFLMLDRVTVTVEGVEKPLSAIDRRDHKNTSLLTVYGSSGVPRAYDYDAHGIEVFPHPDQEYTVTAYYSRAARYIDVEDDTIEIGIPRLHHFYLILHACRQLGMRTIDGNQSDIAAELVKWEGQEVNGRVVGGKIAEYYTQRDEDRVRRLKPKQNSVFSRTRNI